MLFGKFGTVVEAEIIYNDKGSKGFGFVTMSRGKDADYALRKLNHAIVEGRVIEVSVRLSPVCPVLHPFVGQSGHSQDQRVQGLGHRNASWGLLRRQRPLLSHGLQVFG